MSYSLDELELAWAAGFWDGEGCSWKCNGYLALSITQVDRRLLERFADAIGGGTIKGPYGGKRPNENQHYQWRANGKKAGAMFRRIEPYVGQGKREQFNRVCRESYTPEHVPQLQLAA